MGGATLSREFRNFKLSFHIQLHAAMGSLVARMCRKVEVPGASHGATAWIFIMVWPCCGRK